MSDVRSGAGAEDTEPRPSMTKVALGSGIGQMMEWYDFNLFGLAAALVFPALFFPNVSPAIGVLASFATFGVGFLARPIGGWIFGSLGDRIGRQKCLVITLLLMGGATTGMGLLPTVQQIGILAPVLLVLLRLLQGIGVGGEQGGATLIVVEHSPTNRRCFYTGLMEAGEYVGQLLATGLLLGLSGFLSESAFHSWGWRVPFIVSFVLIAVGYWIRRSLKDSPAFLHAKSEGKVVDQPVREMLRTGRRSLLTVVGLRMFENATGYLVPVFALSYLVQKLGVAEWIGTTGVLLGGAVAIFMIPAAGALCDRVGRKKTFIGGVAFLLLFSWPFFMILGSGNNVLIWVAFIAAYAFGTCPMLAAEYVWAAEFFPTHFRYSGFSFGFQLGSILGGGVAPFIATALLAATGLWAVLVYIGVLGVVSLISAISAPETYRSEIDFAAVGVAHGVV